MGGKFALNEVMMWRVSQPYSLVHAPNPDLTGIMILQHRDVQKPAKKSSRGRTRGQLNVNPRVLQPLPPLNSPSCSSVQSDKTAGSPSPSSPLPSKRNISEEKSTRIEISFERFERVLLAPPDPRSKSLTSSLRQLSESMVAGPQWKVLLHAFAREVLPEHRPPYGADPELRFVDLLNFVTNEASMLEIEGQAPSTLTWGVQLSARPPLPSLQSSSDRRPKLDSGSWPLSDPSFDERTHTCTKHFLSCS